LNHFLTLPVRIYVNRCRIEPTAVPRSISPSDIFRGNGKVANKVYSSLDDSFFNSQNIFRQLATRGRDNVISVGDCGMSTVNFSEFLSCLGMTVQETTTLTATITETYIYSSGYNKWTVMGCTPAGFPFLYCPTDSTSVIDPIESSTTDDTTTEFTDTGSTLTDVTDAPPPTTNSVATQSPSDSSSATEPIAP